MQIDVFLFILGLIVLAFFSGLKLAEHYYKMILAQEQYVNKVLSLNQGLGYVARHQSSMPIGTEFMKNLQQNGRAIQRLRKPHT